MEIELTKLEKAGKYVNRIRNKKKKDYAEKYLCWKTEMRKEEPEVNVLSYIAAQAVRMTLNEILNC